MKKYWWYLFLALAVTACGGGGGDDNNVDSGRDCTPVAHDPSYIQWIGSANGDYVIDANDDEMRFRSSDGALVVDGFFFPNIVVDDNSDIRVNGAVSGAGIWAVLGTNGCEITGLVDNATGFYWDIFFVSPGVIDAVVSGKPAAFARPDPDNPPTLAGRDYTTPIGTFYGLPLED